MFKFEFENYKANKGRLEKSMTSLMEKDLGFYDLVDRKEEQAEILKFASEIKGKFDRIVVLGIGGSALGIKTIRDTIMDKKDRDSLRVIDNVDPDFVYENTYDLDFERTIFVVITKSGGTSETMSLFMNMKALVLEKGLEYKDHFVFVTDPKDGLLRKIAERDGVKTFEVPSNVGGRYSVLSGVGLVPAALSGIDITSIIAGAREMRDNFLKDKESANLAYQLAEFQAVNHKEGININVLFPYSNRLLRFGAWYAQLLAESIGKNSETGLTPVTALGATDQHSQLQLFSDGPDDKIYQFLKVENFEYDTKIVLDKSDELLSDKFGFIEGVSLAELLNTELDGTLSSLVERNRPVLKITLDKINEETLGGLFMLYKCATALLGELLDIDAFNQPGVERSKVLTKEYLGKKNA